MVEAEASCQAELEKRVAWQLDQAELGHLMIPSFRRHTSCGTLAEAAVDSALSVQEFVGLAGALPDHARFSHDELYRAIDTYLKAHDSGGGGGGGLSKQEKKWMCRLLDSRKLSPEASFHAGHNDRLPARVIIQILLSEQTKLVTRQLDWSGSFGVTRSPNMCHDGPTRCQSKRESTAQQMEIKKLGEDMMRVEKQCIWIQAQMEKVVEKEKKKKRGFYFFHWKKKLGSVAGWGGLRRRD